ncbi:Ca2+-binding actin-bundling protein [Mycena crocata]|nr:Ca2+-binding actin-bundling protein [Mycena crocata]
MFIHRLTILALVEDFEGDFFFLITTHMRFHPTVSHSNLISWVQNKNAASEYCGKLRTASAALRRDGGSNANVSHTVNEDERTEFTNHINSSNVSSRFPIPTTTDGLILCKLIHDTIDTRVLNKPSARKPLNAFQITENNNIVIISAKGIGCSVVNIGSSDLAEGRQHLILGLIWQVIRRGLLAQVDIKLHPELYRLCQDGETIEDLLRLTADQILLRWFNYHLKAAGWKRRVSVKNFSRDVMDGENYTPQLNLAFVANLFNTHPGLEPFDEQEAKDYGAVEDFDAEGVFTFWLNSLGVEPGVFNLYKNLKDGLILLQAFDKILPGSVIRRRVSKPKGGAAAEPSQLSRFKAVENTNYAVDLAKQNGMHMVGIQDAGITDGSKTLVLGLDLSITTGLFFLDLLDAIRPGIVDPTLVLDVSDSGDYEDRRQNAKLAISIARKVNALIFLVPEDIVDVWPRLILTFVGS